MVSLALLVVWTAWSILGSELVPQTWLPGETFIPNASAQLSPDFGPDYNATLPEVNAPFHKASMEETARQELPPPSPSTSIWVYKIKSGGVGLLTLNKSFYGFFWDTSRRIKNSTAWHGLADLSYTFGPTTLHIYFGHDNTRNNSDWKIGNEDLTRLMYGASIDYKVADSFYVVPVFTYYDWGKQADVTTKSGINKEWIGGLQFRFVF
jgi:hypothetical protein